MLTPLEDARAAVLRACRPLPARTVPTIRALGLVTASEVVARFDVPRFANSAMDGYAVRAEDLAVTPVVLVVAGSVAAGEDASGLNVGPRQAVRIMTGAPIPDGADAIVMVEHTRPAGSLCVRVEQRVGPGTNMRPAGEDVAAGMTMFPPGTHLTAAPLGTIVSAGVTEVSVRSRARVAVVSTGNEISEDWGGPQALSAGQIPDSNRHMLLGLLQEAGCEPIDGGILPDDPDSLARGLRRLLAGSDAAITSGGVSVGDHDHIPDVLERLGRVERFSLAIKPGKPFALGVVDGKPIFGLPGNPVSSFVTFELLARPGLRQMMGHAHLDRPLPTFRAGEDFRRRADGKTHYVRAVIESSTGGSFFVRSAGGQGSHQLLAAARANALVVLPDGEGVAAGEGVRVMLLSTDWS